MPSYTIDSIIGVEKDSYLGLDKTMFTTGGATVYMLHKPDNAPRAGDVIDGTIALDRRQNMKFTKTKSEQFTTTQKPYPVTPTSQIPTSSVVEVTTPDPTKIPTTEAPPTKRFQADPDKMAQDLNVAKATNMSIQRQVAIKSAVDLVVAGKYDDLTTTYVNIMQLLSEPDWRKFDAPDLTPTEADVMQSDDELGRAFDEAIAKSR